MLQPAVRIDLDAIEIVDERVGIGCRRKQRCSEREERFVHGARIALFAAR
jgi:hypothetical protein